MAVLIWFHHLIERVVLLLSNFDSPFEFAFKMDLSPQRRGRPSYVRPQKPQDWEPYKDSIAALYGIMELSAVMEIMEKQHNFKATYVISHRRGAGTQLSWRPANEAVR